MSQEKAKALLAKHVVQWCQPKMTIGLGAGSTVMQVVEALQYQPHHAMQIVVASHATLARCQALGIEATLMQAIAHIDLYIDGADEVDPDWTLLKGRGGAMTGEKLCAQMAKDFVVLIDESKLVRYLGEKWPVLPIEVVPWARSSVARAIVKKGGRPELRTQKSDMGNDILDGYGLALHEPEALSAWCNQLTGVVAHGLFVNEVPQHVLRSDGKTVMACQKQNKS
jgi:ribose 5-phosphate isomerase A